MDRSKTKPMDQAVHPTDLAAWDRLLSQLAELYTDEDEAHELFDRLRPPQVDPGNPHFDVEQMLRELRAELARLDAALLGGKRPS